MKTNKSLDQRFAEGMIALLAVLFAMLFPLAYKLGWLWLKVLVWMSCIACFSLVIRCWWVICKWEVIDEHEVER